MFQLWCKPGARLISSLHSFTVNDNRDAAMLGICCIIAIKVVKE